MNLSYNTHRTQEVYLQNNIKKWYFQTQLKHIFEELFEVNLSSEELVQNCLALRPIPGSWALVPSPQAYSLELGLASIADPESVSWANFSIYTHPYQGNI